FTRGIAFSVCVTSSGGWRQDVPLHSLAKPVYAARSGSKTGWPGALRPGPFPSRADLLQGVPARKGSGIRNHARYLRVVAIGNNRALAEFPLHLRRLRRKNVPRLRMAAHDLAGAGLLEALGCARMCLQLGHFSSRFG